MALDVSSASPEPGGHLRSVSSQHAWQQPPLNSESCITMGGPPTPSSASGVMTNSSPSSATSMGQVAVSNHSGTHSESTCSLERPLRHGKRHSKRNSIHVTIPASPGSGSDSEEHANMNFSNINDLSPSPASFGQKHEQINVNFPSAPFKRLQHPADRNLCASFLGGIVFCLVSLIIGCPVVLFLFAVLPIFYVVRKLILWCCCCCKPGACSCCCADIMSDTELLWYHTSSHKPMVAQCLITLQHGLNIMRIEDLINSRLVSAENKNGSKQYPRFSQKVTSMPIGYAWIKDPEFSIHNHVFHIPETVENDEDLKEFVTELATKPLCLDHPLWEIHILTEFGKSRETVLLFRIHPCVTDGISLVHILFKGLVDNHSLCNLKPRFGSNTVCLNSLRGLLIGPLVFLQKWLCLRRDRNLLHGNHIHLSGKMAIAWSDAFSLPRAQRIKQVSRSSLNDVLMSVAAGCLRTYFQCHGVQNPYDIKTVIPVDLRTDSFRVTMGNKYTFVNVSLPTNTEGIVPRLWELKLRMDDIKSSADSTVLSSVCWLSNFLFSGECFKQVWKTFFDKFTCFISNLPGPEQRLTFASKEIKNLVYWVPPRDQISVSICFMSYADEVRMSVLADRSVIPNPELLTREFILQMDMLSKLLANRRLPGEHISKRLEAMHIAQARMEEPTLEEIHVRMSDIQQHLQELKLRLDGASDNKRADDSTIIRQIEELKGEFRELMSELRLRRMSEGSSMLSDEEEEEDDEVMRRPFRRRTLSVSSRQSTSSVGSMCRPLTTSPAPHQPFPNSPPATTSSLACVNEEAHDVQRIEIHTYRSHHTVEMVTPAIRPGANGKPASDVR